MIIEIIISINAACVVLILCLMDLEKALPLRANHLAASDLLLIGPLIDW